LLKADFNNYFEPKQKSSKRLVTLGLHKFEILFQLLPRPYFTPNLNLPLACFRRQLSYLHLLNLNLIHP